MKNKFNRVLKCISVALVLVLVFSLLVSARTNEGEEILQQAAEIAQNVDESLSKAYNELQKLNNDQAEPASEEELAKVLEDYAALKEVVESNPDYFGVMVPFFTDKDTEESPFGAIFTLTEQDPDETSLEELDQIILGLTQSLNAYVTYYGDELLKVRDQALSKLDDNMSDLEKLLVLHDFIVDWCKFDLADANYMDTGEQDTFIYSTPFGSLVKRSAVCIGYATGYSYLVQNAFPEIYKHEDGTWKTKEEVGDDYIVDYAKAYIPTIHYFNTVKLDGQWYYVDPSFNDVAVQDRQYVRLETAGNVRHQMFLITHESLTKWQNLSESVMDSAYGDLCNDDRYESEWFNRIQSKIYYDDENWYFVRGKVDTRMQSGHDYIDREDQIIARNRQTGEETVLVDLDTSKINTLSGERKGISDLLKEERTNDLIYNKIYPGLQHCIGIYDDVIYFNLGNKIFQYTMNDGSVKKVKEYNHVYAKRDKDEKFIGYSFYSTDQNDTDQVFSISDHPIAGLVVKEDGKLYCEIATNYSYELSHNYDVEAKNYIPTYGYYGENNSSCKQFRWCANVTDVLDMEHVSGSSHDFVAVTVDPSCIQEGYQEKRCTECGISSSEEKTDIKEASGHHFLYDEDQKTNICTKCSLADADAQEHNYGEPKFTWTQNNLKMTCKAVFTCKDCDQMETVDCQVEQTAVDGKEVTCTSDGVVNVKATCEFRGDTYTDEKQNVEMKTPGHCDFKATFDWSDDKTLCYANLSCGHCGKSGAGKAEITEKVVDPTYFEDGKRIYTAEITYNDETFSDQKEEKIAKLKANAKFDKSTYKIDVYEKVNAKLVSVDGDAFEKIETANTKIATVSSAGAITGKSAGTTELTAVTKSGETIKAKITVNTPTVTLNTTSAPVPLNKTSTAIKIASQLSGDSVSRWTCSNKSILAINATTGRVKGKKVGSCKIAVTMKSGAKASCRVKVQKGTIKTTALSVSKTKVTLRLSGTKTYMIKPVLTPVTSQQSVTYSSSSKSIASVSSSGKITAKKAGKVTITVKSGSVSKKITVTVKN